MLGMSSVQSSQPSKSVLLSPIVGLVAGPTVAGTLLFGAYSFPLHFALDQVPGFLTATLYFVFSLAFFLAFTCVVLVLGDTVYTRFLGQAEDNWITIDRSLIAFGVGTWLLCFVSMILGMFGWLHETPLRYTFLLLVFIAFLIAARKGVQIPVGILSMLFPRRVWVRVIVALLFLFLVFQVTICLLPTTDWDDAAYQTTLAKALLERGDLGVWEDAPPFNFPANAQILYIYFTAFHCDAGIRLLDLMMTVLAIVGTYVFGCRVGGKLTGIIAACLLFSCNILWEVGTTSRVDSMVAFYCVVALLCLTGFLRTEHPSFGWLFLLLAGMAWGVKLTGLFVMAIPLVGFAWHARRWKPRWVVAGLLVLLVPSGLWYLRNAIHLGSPVYPLVVTGRGVELATPTFVGPAGPESVYEKADRYFQAEYGEQPVPVFRDPVLQQMAQFIHEQQETDEVPHHLYDLPSLIFHQDKFARKPNHYFNPLLLIGLVFPWLWWRKPIIRLAIVSSVPLIVVAAAKVALLRYLIPVFPFLAIATAWVLIHFSGFDAHQGELHQSKHRMDTKRQSRKLRRLAVILCIAVSLMVPPVLAIEKWTRLSPLPYLTGQQSTLAFIGETGYNDSSPAIADVIRFLNRETKPDDKSLLVGESKGYLLTHPYRGDYEQLGRYADSWLSMLARTGGDHAHCAALLREERFSYLVVNWNYYAWVLSNEHLERRDRLEMGLLDLLRFIERHGEIRLRHDDYWIVKLAEPVVSLPQSNGTVRYRRQASLLRW